MDFITREKEITDGLDFMGEPAAYKQATLEALISIYRDYPDLFAEADHGQINMLGLGWYPLVRVACEWITTYQDQLKRNGHPPIDFKITTIKEKFGGLRIYTSYPHSEELSNAWFNLSIALEKASYRTCFFTGKRGRLMREGMWFVTLSEEEAVKRKATAPSADILHSLGV